MEKSIHLSYIRTSPMNLIADENVLFFISFLLKIKNLQLKQKYGIIYKMECVDDKNPF